MAANGNTGRARTARRQIKTGQRAYAFSKACGIVGKSFVGKRARSVSSVNRLSELDRLIFSDSARDLPEKELLKDIEKRIINRTTNAILAVAGSFNPVPDFIALLIRGWEYENIKNALTAAAAKITEKPVFVDIKQFAAVDFSAWPDIDAIFKDTEFEYLLKLQNKGDIFIQTELDRRYYHSLWEALEHLKLYDRQIPEKILAEEISLRNVVCALRLRTYYQMEKKEIIPHLIDISAKINGKTVNFADDARACLDLPLDNRQAWLKWKRIKFLNSQSDSEGPSGAWKADPRFVQNAAARYLYRMARNAFRTRPFSLDTVFCFFRIKNFEEDVLISSAEGLGMGMSAGDAFAIAGVEQQ